MVLQAKSVTSDNISTVVCFVVPQGKQLIGVIYFQSQGKKNSLGAFCQQQKKGNHSAGQEMSAVTEMTDNNFLILSLH